MDGFLWPWLLGLILLGPLLVWGYRRALVRRARAAVIHPDLELLRQARGVSRQRHFSAWFYLCACLLAALALARPTLRVPEALPGSGIILALDTSRSMRTNDIAPSRFEAAKAALRDFVKTLPDSAQVGLVTFAGYANLAVPLTTEHDRILSAVDLLGLGRGTAIGEGLLKSLEALPEVARQGRSELSEDLATIILLSDGRNRSGIDPMTALAQVKAAGIRVHTVGVGTTAGSSMPDGFGFGGARRFDEATLRTIAEQTGGRYVFVDSANDLSQIYRELGQSLKWHWRQDEVTALPALVAALFLVLSIGLATMRRRVW